jgi:integrase
MSKRYQRGCLRGPLKRKEGPKVWEFFWREAGAGGMRIRKHLVLGTVEELPTRQDAEARADDLRLRINAKDSSPAILRFGAVAGDYEKHELDSERSRLAYPTKEVYRLYLHRWILDRWRNEIFHQVKGADVEAWLDSIDDLAAGSKAKIRNIMSAIYSHAKRHGMTQFNPISTVRQSAQRENVPDVLTPAEARAIAEVLELRELAVAVLGMGNGPRVSESLALKWSDLDFEARTMQIRRSVWHQVINENCKTANSKKAVPLHPFQIAILREWRRATPYCQHADWVFASRQKNGMHPLWPERLRKNLQAAARKAGIVKRVGWHTFRHTLSTMLRANGEDIATQSELLRNTSRTALEHYTQAIPEAKRAAQAKVLDLIFGETSANGTWPRAISGVSQTIN